jgi:hypothetical protein
VTPPRTDRAGVRVVRGTLAGIAKREKKVDKG